MTRTELEAAVGEVLGIHATPDRIGTIVLLAEHYAADQRNPQPVGADAEPGDMYGPPQ
jgi:hypothetical protein